MRTRSRLTPLSAALCAAFIGACLPGLAHSADLLEYYRDALSNDAQYAAARASLAAGQEKFPQGRAGLMPQVTLTGSASRINTEFDNKGVPDSSRNYRTFGYNVQLTQPLFRWANWQQYEQGKLAASLAEAQFGQAQQDLLLRVAQAYFDVLAAEDTITFITAQKAAITEQLASAKRNFEVGTATITDTNEAQARFDLASAQELAARNELNIRRSNLEQIIGRPPGAVARVKAGVRLTAPEPARVEAWVASAERQNFSVAQQGINLEIARRQIEVSRAGRYPTVDLFATRNYNNTPISPPVVSSTGHTIGVQIAVPLYNGGLSQSRVRESLALRERAENDLESSRRTAAQNTRQAFFGVNSGLAQVRALEAAEISSLSALESNRLGYEVGVRINIDVLNAQQQLFQTRRDLAKARYDTLVNSLRLKAAAGSLTETDLTQINSLLEP